MCNIKNNKLISIIVILFLSMIPITALSQSPYRCVSTGINSFEHLSELSYSVKNAQDIGQALEKKGGFSVSYLLGKNENNVIDKQSVLNSLTFNEDELLNFETFIFYFNGHGLNYYGKNYLALTNSTTSDVSTLLSLEELFEKLKKISLKNINVIVFLDACKNTMGSQSFDSYGWVDEENDKELQVLYSTSDLGRSYESYEIKSSVFSYYLIDALNGYAPDLDGDDVVSFDEVVHYVKKNVINWSKQRGFQQIPKTGTEKLVKSLWITFIDREQVLLKQKEQSAQKYILKAQKVFLEKNKKTLQKSHYEKIAQYYNNSIKLYENIYNENPLRIHIYNKISTLKSIIEIIKKLNKSLDSIDKKQFKHAYFELLNTRSKILHNLKLQDYI